MKNLLLHILFLMLISFTVLSYAENSPEYSEAKLEWSKHNFGIINGTGTAKIILTDHDANTLPNLIDTPKVFVYSDSFPEGITLTLYETEKNSGVFERTFTISDRRSAPSVLHAREGDTATVAYTDNTLPVNHIFSEIHLLETTLIGTKGPPLERAPASNARISDIHRNALDELVVDEQILLTSDIANQQMKNQTFVWIAQIIDDKKQVEALSWIEGTLNPESSFSPTTSWIPTKAGKYNVVFFVWESLTNPTALSPPIELEFTVVNENEN